MAEDKYVIPEEPQYRVPDIRKLQDSDPVIASEIMNPTLIEPILESIAYHEKHKAELSKDGKYRLNSCRRACPEVCRCWARTAKSPLSSSQPSAATPPRQRSPKTRTFCG